MSVTFTGMPAPESTLQAFTPSVVNGTFTTMCLSIVASSRPSRIMPCASVETTSPLTGPCTSWQICFRICRGSPPSFAISDGLVVTPSMMPSS